MAFKDRIEEVASDKGMNLTEFAKEIGISYRTLQNYTSGTSPPKMKFYMSVCETFGTTADWLLFGREPKYAQLEAAKFRPKLALTGKEIPTSKENPTFVPIRRYSVDASAGVGAIVDQEVSQGVYAFNPSWLDRRGLKPDSLSVISVSGNSMEPELYDRDLVLVDHASTDLADSNIYAVRFSDALYVKRIQHQPGGKVLLISKNKDYPPIEVAHPVADGVEVIGRIVASMHEW